MLKITENYRREQEAFVSNHGGSTSQEVIYAILPNICSILVTSTTLGIVSKIINRNARVFIEFILIIGPCILCCTILSEHALRICFGMITTSILNIMFMGVKTNTSPPLNIQMQGKRPFITHFRGLTNIITAVCILAVDFRIFPRKFAKTEVFGYSLMDTGVGLFVLANAIVAPETRDFNNRPRTSFARTIASNIKKCTRSCVPLLILGFGRSLAVEYIQYQKHVTEYGVHWNFFITLAFVKLFTSTIISTINLKYSLFSGVWIITMHEYILNTKGVKEWVLSNVSRTDFISANREGLISIPGYVGLYLVGIAVGRLIHSTYQDTRVSVMSQREQRGFDFEIFGYRFTGSCTESMVLCVKLSLLATQACVATLFCDSYFGVSRRLANAGYCVWIITIGVTILTLLILLEILMDILICTTYEEKVHVKTQSKRHKTSDKYKLENINETKEITTSRTLEICEAVNYNGLFFFLFCNLLTGFVNMYVRTLYVDQFTALQILFGYMAVSILSVLVLYRYQIQIKL